jgi:hypothetical protein
VGGSPTAAAALAVPARLGARRSVLASDVAQELGQLAEDDGNLDAERALVAAMGSPSANRTGGRIAAADRVQLGALDRGARRASSRVKIAVRASAPTSIQQTAGLAIRPV